MHPFEFDAALMMSKALAPSKNHFQIAIIGGGMVGASLALLLAHKKPDWQIALLESHPFPEKKSAIFQPSFDARSTAIAQGSVDILQELNLWNLLEPQATAISQVHVSDAGHFLGGKIDAAIYELNSVGFVVPNAWIGRVLLDAVRDQQNIQCIAPVQVQQLLPTQNGMRLKILFDQQISELACDLAVLAEGNQSKLSASLGIEKITKDYDQTAIITNVAFSEPHRGVAYERFTSQGPLALLPLGKSSHAKEAALVLTLSRDTAQSVIQMSDADFLKHLQSRFGFRLGKFLRVAQRHAYELQLVQAAEQMRSHLVLMGNAAHFLHPVAGQGFNLSLRDCTCLVNALIQGESANKKIGELSVLLEYERLQQLDQQLTIGFSDQLVRLFSTQSLPLTALRHLGFMGLDLMPSVKSHFVAQTMGRATQKYI